MQKSVLNLTSSNEQQEILIIYQYGRKSQQLSMLGTPMQLFQAMKTY